MAGPTIRGKSVFKSAAAAEPFTGSGGSSAGIAQGRIVIDTQSFASQRGQVIREARLMGQGIKRELGDGTQQGVKTAISNLGRLENAITNVTRSLTGALSVITTLGVASAQSVKGLNLLFRTLVGSEEEAIEKMDMLREMADKSNQPFLQLVEGATAIIPALRGTNGELDKTLMLIQRLAILDPVQGVAGGAFAVREFLSGEYLSLVKRLELDKSRLKSITAEADGDAKKAIDLLSDYIDEMGLTEEAMYDMGQSGINSFAILRDEGTQTLADFFEPFLNDFVLPLTQGLGDMLRELREVNPELKKFVGISAGLVGTAALAQRGLPFIGSVPGGATAGKAIGVGAAAYGGAQLGGFATRQIADAGVGGGFERFKGKSQGEVMGELSDILKQIAGILIIGMAEFVKIMIDFASLLEEPLNTLRGVIVDVADGIEKAVNKINDLLGLKDEKTVETFDPFGIIQVRKKDVEPTGERMAAIRAKSISPEEKAAIDHWTKLGTVTTDAGAAALESADAKESEASASDKAKDSIDDYVKSLLETFGIIDEAEPEINKFNVALGNMIGGVQNLIQGAQDELTKDDLKITDELLDAWEQHQTDLSDLDEQYQNDTEQELADHEERKADIIASYQQRVSEILESEAIRYERALRKATGKESEIRDNLIKSIGESDKELAGTLKELQEERREGEEDALENHLSKLKDIRENGQDALLRAAMNFDGRAIWEAQRNIKKRTEDERDSYKEERENRRDKYDEAVEDAIAAHDEQIAIAKASADEQIAILWQRFSDEEEMRREDTARRLQKMRDDHQQRMAELNREHTQRMADMIAKYGQERSAMLTAFAQDVMDKNKHMGNLIAIEAQHRKLLEEGLVAWWAKNGHLYMPPTPVKIRAVGSVGSAARSSAGSAFSAAGSVKESARGLIQQFLTSFHDGGPIRKDGPINAQEGEHMLSRGTTNTLQRMLGGNLTQAGLVSAVGGGGGGSDSFSFDINIDISGNGGDSDAGLVEQIRDVTTEVMMEVSQKIQEMRGKAE